MHKNLGACAHATDAELDDALARAIRQLIAEAVDAAGAAPQPETAGERSPRLAA